MEKDRAIGSRIAVVAVVDDDRAVRSALKFSLEIEGFVVSTYRNGNELLQDSSLSRFQCLIVDQYMPGLSGLDLIAKLREGKVAIPAILITTNPSKALVAKAQAENVGIVEKPLIGNALIDKIYDLVRPQSSPMRN